MNNPNENNVNNSNNSNNENNSNDENYVIEMLHIRKEFNGLVANDDITLQLRRGEIHALLGENGAGKSTLMSVLFGLYKQEEGIIKKDGVEVFINDPNDATKLQIGMVHQHFKLVEVYTVLQNIILGAEPLKTFNFKRAKWLSNALNWLNKKIFKVIDMNEARNKVLELSKKYGLNVDPNAVVQDISVGMQQRTEILKMLFRDNDILIFDEPTAVLTPQEIEELMVIMDNLRKEGKSILFISHKLNEIKQVADRCTVLRKGKCVGTVNVKDTTIEELSEMMVGRKVQLVVNKTEAKPTTEVLRVENLTAIEKIHKSDAVKNVSFNVRRGEIVCIAGIDGNGQTELVYSITGLEPIKSGKVYLNKEDITKDSISKRNNKGISHIPEDRHKHGLVLDFQLKNNIFIDKYLDPEFSKFGFIRFDNVLKYSESIINKYDVRSSMGSNSITRGMSGGNQQKAIVGRELERDTDLLIAVQPTRGLDVGAIEFIHKELIEQRDKGKAILLISLELDEVLSLSDRILVMYNGEITGEFKGGTVNAKELGLYMSGAKKDIVKAIKEENK